MEFYFCPTSQNWKLVLKGTLFSAPNKPTIKEFYLSWHDMHPSKSGHEVAWFNIWHKIPTILWWKLWLSQNNYVFNNQLPNHQIVASKTKLLIIEFVGKASFSPLDVVFSKWLGSSFCETRSMDCIKPASIIPWRFRGSVEELRIFSMKSSSAAIFFDGASQGKPWTSSVGGFVSSSDGLVEFSFRWGLEIMSNN